MQGFGRSIRALFNWSFVILVMSVLLPEVPIKLFKEHFKKEILEFRSLHGGNPRFVRSILTKNYCLWYLFFADFSREIVRNSKIYLKLEVVEAGSSMIFRFLEISCGNLWWFLKFSWRWWRLEAIQRLAGQWGPILTRHPSASNLELSCMSCQWWVLVFKY